MNIDPKIDPNTVLYIDACRERWQPFVKGIAEERRGLAGYLCEREASYLKGTSGPTDSLAVRARRGAALKFVFPVLRRISERIAPGETEFGQVYETTEAAFEDVFPEPVWCIWGVRDDRPSEKEKKEFLSPLVERTHASLLAFEKIVSR